MRRPPGWAAWLLGGSAAVVGYTLLPYGWPQFVLSWLVAVSACVTLVVGAWRHHREQLAAWHVFAGGALLWLGGDLYYALRADGGYPTWADAFYLGAYPLLLTALFQLTRRRGPLWSGNLIDSAIVAISVGIVYWTFVIEPVLVNPAVPLLTRAVTAGYPAMGVLLCALLVPMLLRRGPRTAAMWLLTAGGVVTMAANVVYTLLPEVFAAHATLVYAGYLFADVCWAAAAAHPGKAAGVVEEDDSLGWGRLLVLTASMLLVPAILLVQGELGVGRMSWLTVGIGSMALFVLVVTRMSGYIARVRSQARRLHDLAMRDDLTGLPNRRAFEEEAARVVAGGPCRLIMVDLAGFKHVNDRLGRAAGDQALAAVGRLLRMSLREGDAVARMGADEFAVLACDTQPGDGESVVARLLDALRRPIVSGEQELLLNPRFGVADSEDCGAVPVPELVRRADTARYAAKSSGAQLMVYTPELDERADAAASLGAELRHSLDDGDFRVVYQPIVDLRSGRFEAVEALVRWQHPVRGFVSPADFVPVAEDNGLIVELGEFVMRTACHKFAGWRRDLGADGPSYVSVNVSARQLSEPGFPEVVAAILDECGLAPAELLAEVTETALFGGGTAVQAVETLHAAGVRIALDDFGTGHSSLGLLRTVPVDVLKVDKSFVDEIIAGAGRAVIVDALIHVSKGLRLRAVAEGVETAEQARYLRRLGYEYAQGYFFGRPVPDPEFRPELRDPLPDYEFGGELGTGDRPAFAVDQV
ncbi:diguanylate cyclase [Actinoplanes sp. SE50]|uniref:putative bifunctional diguanylate cyclase/phosphodiesterase n=1 Tax=unclassified Actinoplanes TaxID=2626549 RepID=UPI00023ECD38|nr:MULTISPECIES: EAL domain-containing protein [unclassified Actinoplanes]AEV86567.1 putative signaling protein [Actinoplanes sp. SE50/110]ATO84965.1 diguanylate cyclase [Actinoplanes sp. SE50]SLM02374.1 diguanylate cyclase [Actinoplanes sp. SE50/110]